MDDSFIKLHEASFVLFAARVRIVRLLVSISWNGNYNGFDLLLKYSFFSLGIGVWFSLRFVFVPRIVFPGCLLLGGWNIAYWAPSSGEIWNWVRGFSLYMSALLWVDDSHLEVTLFSLLFSVGCYLHQRVMISVIKLCWVVGLADLHGVNV